MPGIGRGGLANRHRLAAKLFPALWGISQCNGFWVFPGVASKDKRGCLSWFSSMETGPLAKKMPVSNPEIVSGWDQESLCVFAVILVSVPLLEQFQLLSFLNNKL